MTINQFIEKAIEGGWKPNKLNSAFAWEEKSVTHGFQIDKRDAILDPEAWKAVGRVKAWSKKDYGTISVFDFKFPMVTDEWLYNMHRMIDALVEGKSIEQYLETI